MCAYMRMRSPSIKFIHINYILTYICVCVCVCAFSVHYSSISSITIAIKYKI